MKAPSPPPPDPTLVAQQQAASAQQSQQMQQSLSDQQLNMLRQFGAVTAQSAAGMPTAAPSTLGGFRGAPTAAKS